MACAASSAVPGLLTPLTLKNYAGSCGFVMPPLIQEPSQSYRVRAMRETLSSVMDSEKKKYFHLIDGGVADNLGLRAIEESIESAGSAPGPRSARREPVERCCGASPSASSGS